MSRSAIGLVAGAIFVMGLGAAPAIARFGGQPDADPLQPVSALVGSWKGSSEGKPGSGTVERSYERALNEPDSSAARVVFTSEAIENIPAGWKGRETYIMNGTDAFEEIFELAEPGKPFELYSRARFTRVK